MKVKSRVLAIVIIACCILLAGCGWVTIEPIKTETEIAAESGELDPIAYAKDIWPQIFDYAVNNAHPVEDVVPLFLSDKDAAGEQYGHRLDKKSWWQFIVTGNAKVLKYNTESKAGVLELDLEPFDGTVDCFMQIGTIMKGQALRDAMPFIKFQDFKEQVEFGNVASEINNYALENVIVKVVTPDIEGKIINFTGAYTAEPGRDILIVPVELAVSEE